MGDESRLAHPRCRPHVFRFFPGLQCDECSPWHPGLSHLAGHRVARLLVCLPYLFRWKHPDEALLGEGLLHFEQHDATLSRNRDRSLFERFGGRKRWHQRKRLSKTWFHSFPPVVGLLSLSLFVY